jgi:hypothetical protein
LLIQKYAAENLAVSFRQLIQNPGYDSLALLGDHKAFRPGAAIYWIFGIFRQLALARLVAQQFERNVVANRMDKTWKAGGPVQYLPLAKVSYDTKKGLLAGIFNQFRRSQTRPQLQSNRSREMTDQKALGVRIPIPNCE